ncbi:hypothetical protein CRUP_015344 [Coryphaenoides rupestris]|nr:hypothetical protein CRUP_015344 [Coryphaenoides rupestris]
MWYPPAQRLAAMATEQSQDHEQSEEGSGPVETRVAFAMGILSWPNPSPETVLFFSGRVEPPHDSQEDLRDDLSINSYCRMEQDDEVQEAEALLCLPMDPSLQLGEGPEPSETSHDTSRSADTLRPRRAPQHPHATRTKHPSGSNVSFSHDTEGGEDQHAQVRHDDDDDDDNTTTTTTTTTNIRVLRANMLR